MIDPDRLAEIKAILANPRPPGIAEDPIIGRFSRADIDWLVGEVEDLRRAVAASLNAANDEDRENEQLRDLLRGIEWAAGDDFGAACPECEAYRDSKEGHDPGCKLVAALAGRVTHHDLLPGNDDAPPSRS